MNPRKLEKALKKKAEKLRRKRENERGAQPTQTPKPNVTLVPANASRFIPKSPKKANDEADIKTASSPFDSAADNKPRYIERNLFSRFAKHELEAETINPETFRALCATAIAFGGISTQDMVIEYGDVIPRDVDRSTELWPLPSPNIMRNIMEKFSTFTEDQFTGSKLPWRHARSRQFEAEPTLQD